MLFDEMKIGQYISYGKGHLNPWYGIIIQKDELKVIIKWLNLYTHLETINCAQRSDMYPGACFFSELELVTEEDVAIRVLAHLGT